ncbi:MAG: hypothetical protein JSV44_12545 [Candidatus Zixiibacteriota bacterium]|nr:MAG: hypothetical protein JSV44_12545 [candidate division Zixibacteria bacterium]
MKNRIQSKLRSENGVSLLEALLALFLAGIVTVAIFKVYVNQHKNWSIQEQVTDMQQNARAAIDELTRQIRMAGHKIPIQLDGIQAYNTNPDTIIISYASSGCRAPIEHKMPTPSSELRCDGHDISCFYEGQWVYIFHPDSGGGDFFEITEVQVAASHIQHNKTILSRSYDKNAIVLALEQVKYYIDYSDTLHPNLMMKLPGRSPEVYAENIEDLQFQYRMKNGVTVDVPAIPEDIREVIISLTARTAIPDPDFPDDPYRRRTFASSVNLRNLDI